VYAGDAAGWGANNAGQHCSACAANMSSTTAAAILRPTPTLPNMPHSSNCTCCSLSNCATAATAPGGSHCPHSECTTRGHRSQQCSQLVVPCLQAVKQHSACQHGCFSCHESRQNKYSSSAHQHCKLQFEHANRLRQQLTCVTTWCRQMCRVPVSSCADKA
jgi:hypothetical protein